ncbi:MAG: translational initiation factor [Gammaproteobacteria bacterium SG8_11]|jgi:muconolactone delta-isomerase|nr:MAG: translational initiation factor [Gammaproteobacteria bacterium SG8_11]
MLFFVKVRVDHTKISEEELWDLWEKEAESALAAKEAGKIVALYKVVGQRRVVMIVNVESHDELDRLAMGAMPMRHILECEEILPVRDYDDFAKDVKRRWKL